MILDFLITKNRTLILKNFFLFLHQNLDFFIMKSILMIVILIIFFLIMMNNSLFMISSWLILYLFKNIFF